MYRHILIIAKLKTGKRGQETELTGRSPLRRRESTSDCSAIQEEKKKNINFKLKNIFQS